jgi:hypothetical protein
MSQEPESDEIPKYLEKLASLSELKELYAQLERQDSQMARIRGIQFPRQSLIIRVHSKPNDCTRITKIRKKNSDSRTRSRNTKTLGNTRRFGICNCAGEENGWRNAKVGSESRYPVE